jgi:hypothetical protein
MGFNLPWRGCIVCAGYQFTDGEVGRVSCVAVWMGMYVIYGMI